MTSVVSSATAHALSAINRTLPDQAELLSLRTAATLPACTAPDPKAVTACHPDQSVCLFNVTGDPCETDNVAFKYPDAVLLLEQTLAMYRSSALPPANKKIDPRANPKYFGYTWTNWLDFVDPLPHHNANSTREELLRAEEEEEEGLIAGIEQLFDADIQRWLQEQKRRPTPTTMTKEEQEEEEDLPVYDFGGVDVSIV